MDQLLTELEGPIMEILAGLAFMAITAVSGKAFQFFGVKIEEKHARLLASAIANGVRAALEKRRGSGNITNAVIEQMAVDYAKKSVPDAIKKLKPAEQTLKDMAKAQINKTLAQQGLPIEIK